jgi:outer membrane protein TolC
LPGLPALLAKVSSSAGLRAAEARGRAAAGRVLRARREGRPALTLEGGADIDDPTQEGTDKHLSLGLTIPIGSRAAVLVSSAEEERAAAEKARIVRSVEAEVVSTWNRAEASRQRLEVLDGFTIPAAREAAELSRTAYQEGRLDLLRLLESERTLADISANRIETWVLWGSQRASLERLVGGKL